MTHHFWVSCPTTLYDTRCFHRRKLFFSTVRHRMTLYDTHSHRHYVGICYVSPKKVSVSYRVMPCHRPHRPGEERVIACHLKSSHFGSIGVLLSGSSADHGNFLALRPHKTSLITDTLPSVCHIFNHSLLRSLQKVKGKLVD